MAVADVHGARGRPQAVHEGAAAGEEHLARGRPQPPDGPGVEGQKPPEVLLSDAETLQRRGPHLMPGEATLGRLAVVEQREHRRAGMHVGHLREHALGAAEHQQVVVGEDGRRARCDRRVLAHAGR